MQDTLAKDENMHYYTQSGKKKKKEMDVEKRHKSACVCLMF